MEIKDFLKLRPFINVASIERALNIPTGTIRLTNDRPIPDKYKDQIISLLSIYGWNTTSSSEPTAIIRGIIKEVKVKESGSIPNYKGLYLKIVKTTLAKTGWYLCAFIKNSDPKQMDLKATDDDIPDRSKIIVLDEIIS
jgi:hypothetical protein